MAAPCAEALLLGQGLGDPMLQGLRQGAGDGCALLDHGVRGPDPTRNRRHPRLAQDRETHTRHRRVRRTQHVGDGGPDTFSEAAAPDRLEAGCGEVGDLDAGLRSYVEPDIDLSVESVRSPRLLRLVRVLQRHDGRAAIVEVVPECRDETGQTTGIADDDPATMQGTTPIQQRLGLSDSCQAGVATGPITEASENRDGVAAAYAVAGDAGVSLEVLERHLGVGSEESIDASGVEPERRELSLQVGHIVAAERR